MSHKVSKILPILLLVAGILTAPVQAQKIGYTNQQALLDNMPEMQEVQKKMQKAAKQQQRQMRRKQQKLQKRLKQYRQQRSLLDSTARRQRERKLRQRRRKLMQPLLKNLQSAINLVANRRNIDMVVRSQALLFVKQNSDQVVNITSDVASELDITLSQNPGTPSPSVNPSTPSPSGGGSGGR